MGAGQPPIIYEDGKQTRDFINITDVIEANLLAMKRNSMKHSYYNIGTGIPTSITEVAQTIAKIHHTKIVPTITGQYRAGDIRHCWADISKIESQGFKPKVTFQEGMMELGQWTKNQEATENFEEATSELVPHDLVSRRSNRG